MTARIPGKKQVLLAFLERGVAMVHLDARRPGVKVPVQHGKEAHLRLNLSYRYRIPDFEIGDDAVQATLSFGGQPFLCVLPWPAIFGITSQANGDGQVWPEDLPVEVADASGTPVPPPETRPALAAVESDAPALAAVESDAPALAAVERDAPALAAVESDAPALAAVESDAPALAAVESDAPRAAGKDPSSTPPGGAPRRHLRLVR